MQLESDDGKKDGGKVWFWIVVCCRADDRDHCLDCVRFLELALARLDRARRFGDR